MCQSVKLTVVIWLLQLVIFFPSHLCTGVTRVKPRLGFKPGYPPWEADDLPTELSPPTKYVIGRSTNLEVWHLEDQLEPGMTQCKQAYPYSGTEKQGFLHPNPCWIYWSGSAPVSQLLGQCKVMCSLWCRHSLL